MNNACTTFDTRLSDKDLKLIRRRAEEMRAAYLRSLFARLFSFGAGRETVEGGLTATR